MITLQYVIAYLFVGVIIEILAMKLTDGKTSDGQPVTTGPRMMMITAWPLIMFIATTTNLFKK